MRVIGERPLFGRQVSEKAEASDAIGANSCAVDPRVAPHKVAQVIPVEFRALLEFVHEARRIESIARLPELQYDEPADERLIERPGRVYSEIINIPRLIALIAGADLFSENFRQRETVDFSRSERQEFEITLFALNFALRRQRRRLTSADLQSDFTVASTVPFMRVGRIHAPRQAVHRFVITAIGNIEPDPVEFLF